MTTRDTVLLIIHAAGDEVAGRTVMQKLAYFVSVSVATPLGHSAHYYGPYSSQVEDAIANAVIAGEAHEIAERMPSWGRGPDLLRYTYQLQPAGKARVDALIERAPQEWDHVRDTVVAIKQAVPDLDQKTLSTAAKTHLIVSEARQAVDPSDIPRLAKNLGWDIDRDQVAKTVEILKQLGLVLDAETTA